MQGSRHSVRTVLPDKVYPSEPEVLKYAFLDSLHKEIRDGSSLNILKATTLYGELIRTLRFESKQKTANV